MSEAEIELTGHIIDSMILPKIFGAVYDLNGEFEVLELRIGKTKSDYSYASMRIMGQRPPPPRHNSSLPTQTGTKNYGR
nr:hypothetical protein [Candidatus Freyarchaeota archaeon]